VTAAIEPVPSGTEVVPNAQGGQSRQDSDVFRPRPGGPAERIGERGSPHNPGVVALVVLVCSYVAIAVVALGVGVLVVATFVDTSLGARELRVNEWFVDARTSTWNSVTAVGSSLASTQVVLAVAAVAVIVLWLTRHRPACLFFASGLLLEVTVFLTAAFLIDRDRPDVLRLDSAPPTSSYPSGHTAASVVLYIGLAIVLVSVTRVVAARIAGFAVASVFVTLVTVSRLYRGMHHLGDVVAGVLLGVACLLAALLVTRSFRAVQEYEDVRDREMPI